MASYKPIPSLSAAQQARFWANVRKGEQPESCWLWLANRNKSGYGRFATYYAHRVAYTLMQAPIPEGLTLDHLCRNKLCVNPAHLEPVLSVVNVMRGQGAAVINARKSHCPHGHEYSKENTIIGPAGRRHCRACASPKSLRSAGRCVWCRGESKTYRCDKCAEKHNANRRKLPRGPERR